MYQRILGYKNMSLRGVRQLKELVVLYSDIDGSSKGIREWMKTSLIPYIV